MLVYFCKFATDGIITKLLHQKAIEGVPMVNVTSMPGVWFETSSCKRCMFMEILNLPTAKQIAELNF